MSQVRTGAVLGGPAPLRRDEAGRAEAPQLPEKAKYLQLSQMGLSANDRYAMRVPGPLPGFTSVAVTSVDGGTLYSHSDVDAKGDLGWPHKAPDSSAYGQVPTRGQVRVTLERPDGWFTAVVNAAPPGNGGAGANRLEDARFEWIPRPTTPTPADAPKLNILPKQLHVSQSSGLQAFDLRPPVASAKEPLKGFTGAELTSADGSTVHAWSDVSANGNLGWPRRGKEDAHAVDVPANDALRLNLHHPDGVLTALIPAARGNDVLRNPHAARSVGDLQFEWRPHPVQTPTVPIVDGWQTSSEGARVATRPLVQLAPPSSPGAAHVPSPADDGTLDWGSKFGR